MKHDFEIRLERLLNTYYLASINPISMLGNFSIARGVVTTSVQGVNTVLVKKYKVNHQWLLVYIACCTVVLLVAILGTIRIWVVVAPDVLGYASSFTEDTPYVSVPEGKIAV